MLRVELPVEEPQSSGESGRFTLPTLLCPRSPPRRPAQLVARLFGVAGFVCSGVSTFAAGVPAFHESVPSMSPRELHSRKINRKSLSERTHSTITRKSDQRTLIKAVVAPIAAATGILGTRTAPSQGNAVPSTVPASAAVPAPIMAYF